MKKIISFIVSFFRSFFKKKGHFTPANTSRISANKLKRVPISFYETTALFIGDVFYFTNKDCLYTVVDRIGAKVFYRRPGVGETFCLTFKQFQK